MVTVHNLIQSFSFMAGNNHVVISYQKRQETIKRFIKSVYQKIRNRAYLRVHNATATATAIIIIIIIIILQ